jgi:hypothetical protein
MDTRLLHYLSEVCVSVIVLAFLGLSLAGCLGPQVPSVHYYVSPTGSDRNPGTISQPFRTLDHARLTVQGVNKHMSGDIFVSLRGGTYPLSQTLAFEPGDSGTNGYNIIYEAYAGEKPVISGGQTITVWSLHDHTKNIWQATVGTKLQTRQLYVNGVRAIRARSSGGLPGRVTQTSTGYTTTDTSLQHWRTPNALEFVYTGASANSGAAWVEPRCGVASISGTARLTTIRMKQPCYTNAYAVKLEGQTITQPTYLENAYELLNQAGEWYLDHSAGVLYYIPRPGENMLTAMVVAPVIETLVSGSGTLEQPVHNIAFKGITFAYATWLQTSGNDGFVEVQANEHYVGSSGYIAPPGLEFPQGNVSFQGAKALRFERDIFIHLGNAGLRLWNGSQNNVVIGNVFTDISATGVLIGDVELGDPPLDTGNQVIDNYIHDVAVEYHGGVGLFGGWLANTIFSHNEIANLPYSGISLGWGWSSYVSAAHHNIIEDNLIYNIVQLLGDGGGIYLNGQTIQPTSIVRGNYIHDQGDDSGAIYPDEGSTDWDINNNVMASVPQWLFIWSASIHDVTIHENYSDTYSFTDASTNTTLSNDPLVTDGNWPAAALNIMKHAGIETTYQSITTAAQ